MSYLQTSNSQDEPLLQYSYYLHQDSDFLYTQSINSIPPITSQPHHPYYHCISTIKCNNSYISSLVIHGKSLYTGSSNKEIRIWKRDTLTTSHKFDQEYQSDSIMITGEGAIKSLIVSSDKIFSAHQDHKIRAWKVEGQERKLTHLATLPTFGDWALKLLTPKNHVQVRRHKTSTRVNHVDTVSALALSRDGLVIYSVSWDRTLKIWRTTDFKCVESVANAHDDAINTVAISSNGDVYTGSTDKRIKIWRKSAENQNHFLVTTLKKHKSGVNALALSSNEMVLYSGASDRSIMVWEKSDDEGNMVIVTILRGHSKSILCLSVVSDLVCSGSEDETIRIWRGMGKCYFCLAVLEGHKGPVKCLTSEVDDGSSSDTLASYFIYSGGLDSDIKVWQIFIPLC
ncbi:unnamed protein product [Lactuca saligna]|uniref:Uncharacterized protein n=1 Tax=Lactuca saligna TaxID=75948 RepID=A0AA35YUD3_LACSI|nr:unnamed protein product [Lactuca saligna]